jgi:hypothetical protein
MSRSLLGYRLIRSKEVDRLHAQLSSIQEESESRLAQMTRQLHTLEDELRTVRDKCASLEQAARSAPDPQQPASADPARLGHDPLTPGAMAGPPRVVRELVGVADKLADLAGDHAPADPQQAAAALRWLQVRTQALLAACDVARVEDGGLLDMQRHQVIATRAAPAEDLVDHIADTVRPGYAWQGSLLRPQQVIAYVPADEARGA